MRIACYARVSTLDQRCDGQLDALRAYCERRGAECLEFTDHGISGSRDRRPALDQLMAACRRREVDAVACVKLDRLARSTRHLVTLSAELDALGVDLVVLDSSINTACPSGRLLFTVLAGIAEFERDLIRERTRAGLHAARKRGKRLGRPRARLDVGHAVERLERGETISAIAERYGISRSTLRARMAEWRKTSAAVELESIATPTVH